MNVVAVLLDTAVSSFINSQEILLALEAFALLQLTCSIFLPTKNKHCMHASVIEWACATAWQQKTTSTGPLILHLGLGNCFTAFIFAVQSLTAEG
jgi:hypothetical protein